MKAFRSILAMSVAVLALPAFAADRVNPPPALTTDPFMIIYRASGVIDNGAAANLGVATSFHCTNFGPTTDNLKIVIRGYNGVVVANPTYTLVSFQTFTASTHSTVAYVQDGTLAAGSTINQGSVVIAATSPYITCTAVVVDASTAVPIGTPLHLVRFVSYPGAEGE